MGYVPLVSRSAQRFRTADTGSTVDDLDRDLSYVDDIDRDLPDGDDLL